MKIVGQLGDDPAKNEALLKQLEADPKYKALASGIRATEAAMEKHKGTLQKMDQITAPVDAALQDCGETRAVYLQALQLGKGDPKAAQKIFIEMQLLQQGAQPDQLPAIEQEIEKRQAQPKK